MAHYRDPFEWPDPLSPVVIKRSFKLLRKRPSKGKKPPPLEVKDFALIELVPHCLYEVPAHSVEALKDIKELQPGRILSRNLKVSERLNGVEKVTYAQQCFISYESVYKARRGMAHAQTRGKHVELPALASWDETFDWMVKTSWTLHLLEEDGREEYVLVAAALLDAHGRVIDENKVAALARAIQAGKLKDSLGRFNPGRIPLIIFAGQKDLAQRIQAVRGITRRMSFREVVLEVYIDRLRIICRQIGNSQLHRLQSRVLFGDDRLLPVRGRSGGNGAARSTATVRREADRLEQYARQLEQIVTRPFVRSLRHSVRNMREAAAIMREAADVAKSEGADAAAAVMLRARDVLMQSYHGMVLRDLHWQLEELLLQAVILIDRGEDVADSRQIAWHDDLRAIHRRLTRRVPETRAFLDDGFARKVRASVFPHVHLADVHLMRKLSDGGPDLEGMSDELRKACAPL